MTGLSADFLLVTVLYAECCHCTELECSPLNVRGLQLSEPGCYVHEPRRQKDFHARLWELGDWRDLDVPPHASW